MKRLIIRVVFTAVAAAAAVAACRNDPTSSLRGGPKSLDVQPILMLVDEGSNKALSVVVRDEQLNPLTATVTATSLDQVVATLTIDNTVLDPQGARHTFQVRGAGLDTTGKTKVVLNGAGIIDTAEIIVLPTLFHGNIANLAPRGGDTLVITGTKLQKFRPAGDTVSAVAFFRNHASTVLRRTVDSLVLLVPFSDSGPVKITVDSATYIAGVIRTVTSVQSVKQTGNAWSTDTSFATGPDISGRLPASGKSIQMLFTTAANGASQCPEIAADTTHNVVRDTLLNNNSLDTILTKTAVQNPCMYFKFTLAGTTTLNFTLDWEGTAADPDMNIRVCSDSTKANWATACHADGQGGATDSTSQCTQTRTGTVCTARESAVRPEVTGDVSYAAGTYWLVITKHSGASTARNIYLTISRP